MSKEPSMARAVELGYTLYEVVSSTGSTMELDYRKPSILRCVEGCYTCTVFKYSGETKRVIFQKLDGHHVFGSIDSIREERNNISVSEAVKEDKDRVLGQLADLFGSKRRRGGKSTLSDSDAPLFAT